MKDALSRRILGRFEQAGIAIAIASATVEISGLPELKARLSP